MPLLTKYVLLYIQTLNFGLMVILYCLVALILYLQANGRSALATACASGSAAVVKALLAKGADPNVRDKRQLTPVHLAAESGVLDIVKVISSFILLCAVT